MIFLKQFLMLHFKNLFKVLNRIKQLLYWDTYKKIDVLQLMTRIITVIILIVISSNFVHTDRSIQLGKTRLTFVNFVLNSKISSTYLLDMQSRNPRHQCRSCCPSIRRFPNSPCSNQPCRNYSRRRFLRHRRNSKARPRRHVYPAQSCRRKDYGK